MCMFMLSLRPFGIWPARFFSMEFSRQQYRSGLPFPSPGNFPNSEIELGSPAVQAESLLTEPSEKEGKGVGDGYNMSTLIPLHLSPPCKMGTITVPTNLVKLF